jgi:hypothetical protein
VQAIFGSTEARVHTVAGLYDRFLHRAADPGGLSFFVGLLQSGAVTEEQVAAVLLGSAEFASRV